MRQKGLAVCLSALLLLSSCGSGSRQLLHWEDSGGTLTLLADGTLRLTPGEGRWILTGTPDGGGQPLVLELRRQGNILTVRCQTGQQTLTVDP